MTEKSKAEEFVRNKFNLYETIGFASLREAGVKRNLPITLNYWLMALEGDYAVNEIGMLGKYHYDNDIYWLKMLFDMTTGQPATEEDFRTFNSIVGVNE